jgi:hypothetical protein
MSFHISQELLFERAIVVWATILLFGLVSIGGLWILRKYQSRGLRQQPAIQTPATAHMTSRDADMEVILAGIRRLMEEEPRSREHAERHASR